MTTFTISKLEIALATKKTIIIWLQALTSAYGSSESDAYFLFTIVGIVPKLCERIFEGIEEQRSRGAPVQYEVKYSMLEIYNEVVYDLLAEQPTDNRRQRVGLKIRQHPKKGFFGRQRHDSYA